MILKSISSNITRRLENLRYTPDRYFHRCPTRLQVDQISERNAKSIDRSRLRNIGIIAHINAGKTTTTERFLYHAGSTTTVGDVDKGNTITDYLSQERDRGITITSAAVTFDWKKHRINLIDTPGHVDFTIEVERSLSVLDGAVTILDASAGVEAQTITVWNQASNYKLPNVIFLNKCDKPQADYNMCMKDLTTDLEIKASLIQIPIKDNNGQISVVDLVNRQQIIWLNPEHEYGTEFRIEPLDDSKLDKKHMEKIELEREKLINVLTDVDEELASHLIECDKISDVNNNMIHEALQRATKRCLISPVLVGSSFKYIGVQQLLDSIIAYLPSPLERRNQVNEAYNLQTVGTNEVEKNCAFIFKIMHDKRLGPLTYLRVASGSVEKLQRFKILDSDKTEQIKKVYRVFADDLKEIQKPVERDDIVVATGLVEARTGDILLDQDFVHTIEQTNNIDNKSTLVGDVKDEVKKLPFHLLNKQIVVPYIERMEPVYFCSIEASSMSHQIKLERALACMSREDPSLTYEIDSRGITTIRGMGKLHLEIARDRIESEYGVDALLGPIQISYRETIDGSATEELKLNRLVNSVNNTLEIILYIRSKPKAGIWKPKHLRLDLSGSSNSLNRLRNDHKRAIENGLTSALMHGPTLGFPVIDCDISLLEFKANNRCGLPLISSAASQCLMSAMRRCTPVLLEPIMQLEVVVPKEKNGLVLSDITSRRGLVQSTTARPNGMVVVRSRTPLATLADYSEFLRISTSGRASFSMELHSYRAMSEADRQSVVRL